MGAHADGRAVIEGVIKELKAGFGLPGLCCKKFFATEAALSLCVFTDNLTVLFARHLGWLERVSIGTLRYRLFGCAGIISRAQAGPRSSWASRRRAGRGGSRSGPSF